MITDITAQWFDDPAVTKVIGRKARGLSLIPPAWRPPFAVLAADVYADWFNRPADRETILAAAAIDIEQTSRPWRTAWPRGLILRSSSENETLEERGVNISLRLAADLDRQQIEQALGSIFSSFAERNTLGGFAVIVQPLAGEGPLGHISNERRISPTVNQWQWERIAPTADAGKFNSWRDRPNINQPLISIENSKNLNRAFGAVGRWVTDLKKGPAHLEWIFDGKQVWLLQLDFEFEQPDDGVDPTEWLRQTKHLPSVKPTKNSVLDPVSLQPTQAPNPWRKIENVRRFAAVCPDPYPLLVTITGEKLRQSASLTREALEADLEAFAHGRVVCRTDCNTPGITRENLPRTNTVSSNAAIDNMVAFLTEMEANGAKAEDVCFIAHQFIPARSGAWVRADPSSPIVRVDALWGLPDGLQYLPHDTFDVDVQRKVISAERLRFKPGFIQETPDGSWRRLKIRRSLGRTRSLPTNDAIRIAIATHELVRSVNKPQMVMWFCGIPPELGIGANLPWFSMPPNPAPTLTGDMAAPRWPRIILRSLDDVDDAMARGAVRNILLLDPDVSLFRDNRFVDRVIELAKRDNCPVQLAGSSLAHAYYQLERAGVSVVSAEPSTRTRARGRRSFDKLVRREMPSQIASRGEIVVQSRLPRSEMRRALVAKLMEEAQELLAATDPDDVKSELADLLEVIRAMANITGVSWTEIETSADIKRDARGGFEDGAVLVVTEWPTTDRSTQRAPSMTTLRNLGKVASGLHKGSATYNAIVASAAGVKIEIDKRALNIRLDRNGIIIEASQLGGDLPSQLELPLAEDHDVGDDNL